MSEHPNRSTGKGKEGLPHPVILFSLYFSTTIIQHNINLNIKNMSAFGLFFITVVTQCHKRKRCHKDYFPHGPSGISIQESSCAARESSSDNDDDDEPRRLPSSFALHVQSTLTSEGLLQGA